jgi:hypothetical protein
VALATMVAVYHWCQVGPGVGTVVRTAATGAIVYLLAKAWDVTGAWVIPQVLALFGAVLLLLFVLGELTVDDLRFAVSLVQQTPAPDTCGGTDLPEQRAVGRQNEPNDEYSG